MIRNANIFGVNLRLSEQSRLTLLVGCAFFLISSCGISQPNTHGTTVAVWWFPESLFIAADTKVNSEDTTIRKVHICKIQNFDGVFFAQAGDSRVDSTYITTNVAKWAISNERTFGAITKKFTDSTMSAFRNAQKNSISNKFVPKSVAGIFITDSNKGIQFYVLDVKLDTTSLGIPFIDSMSSVPPPPENCHNCGVLITLGFNDHINNCVPCKNSPFWRGTPTRSVEELVRMECIEHPDSVGEPISVLEIRRKTFNWINHECTEVVQDK